MTPTHYVADAGALIAYLRSEPGYDVFEAALGQPGAICYAHAANLAEVFYDSIRVRGETRARELLGDISAIGVVFREDMDTAFWQDAARTKADYRRVSLADCFGLALARRVGGVFLTTDHHELDALAEAGVCDIRFIR